MVIGVFLNLPFVSLDNSPASVRPNDKNNAFLIPLAPSSILSPQLAHFLILLTGVNAQPLNPSVAKVIAAIPAAIPVKFDVNAPNTAAGFKKKPKPKPSLLRLAIGETKGTVPPPLLFLASRLFSKP